MTEPLDGLGQRSVEAPGVCSAVEGHLDVMVKELRVDWGSGEVVA